MELDMYSYSYYETDVEIAPTTPPPTAGHVLQPHWQPQPIQQQHQLTQQQFQPIADKPQEEAPISCDYKMERHENEPIGIQDTPQIMPTYKNEAGPTESDPQLQVIEILTKSEHPEPELAQIISEPMFTYKNEAAPTESNIQFQTVENLPKSDHEPELPKLVHQTFEPIDFNPVRQKSDSVSSRNSGTSSLVAKTESLNSQNQSQNSAPVPPDQQNPARNSPDSAVVGPAVQSRRRGRDNLHKRYKEATKKSQEIFARLNVSLLSTINDESRQGSPILADSHSLISATAKRIPLILVPPATVMSTSKTDPNLISPDPQILTSFHSARAESTPILLLSRENSPRETSLDTSINSYNSINKHIGENKPNSAVKLLSPAIKGGDELSKSTSAPITERERMRRSGRGSFSSAYDGHQEEHERRRDAEKYKRGDRRRPGSRASEYGGSRGYRSYHDDYGRRPSRPHSTYDFGHSDDESMDSEDQEDDYEEDYEYNYRRHRFYQGGSLRSNRGYGGNVIADPAWQKYLYEFYCHHGYYPTYEQLHQMWADQQTMLNSSNSSVKQQRILAGRDAKPAAPGTNQAAKKGQASTSLLSEDARYRTEAYVANQQQRLFDVEKASQLSVSVSGIGSDRSYDIPSSNVSGADAFGLDVPLKHSVGHSICRFGVGGQLAVVKGGGGRSGGHRETVVEISHVRNLIKHGCDPKFDALVEKFEGFPGPLSPMSSDKNLLIQFCQRQIEIYRQDVRIMDGENAILIWNMLAVLIRQNGNVTGPDLSHLLMEGCASYGSSNVTEVESQIFFYKKPAKDVYLGEGGDSHDRKSPSERTLINTTTQTIDRVEQHFRELLLAGSKKEALEWAIKHKLWGHALFLAMKIDQRTHTNVMIRFANSLPLTDPLQTLYQMLSGVTPSAVTRLCDEQWSDWRQHLSMMLSNLSLFNGVPTNSTAFDRELTSVLMLGNTLMDHGRTFAAQFCYLCCHILGRWDVFTPQNGRNYVSLLGAHSETKEDDIFTIDRYQMTEMYEYVAGLSHYATAKQQLFLPTLQIYKLRYCLQLLELGYAETAYRYFKALGSAILLAPCLFPSPLIDTVLELSKKLSRLELDLDNPSFESSSNQYSLPAWILNLQQAAAVEKPQNSASNSTENSEAQPETNSIHQNHNEPKSVVEEEALHYQQQREPERHFYIGMKKEEKQEFPIPTPSNQILSPEMASRRESIAQPAPPQFNGIDHTSYAPNAGTAGGSIEDQIEHGFLEQSRNRQISLTADPFTTFVESQPATARRDSDFLATSAKQTAPLTPRHQQLTGFETETYSYYNNRSEQENNRGFIPNGPTSLGNVTTNTTDYFEQMTQNVAPLAAAPVPKPSAMNNKPFMGSPSSASSDGPLNDSVFTASPPSQGQRTPGTGPVSNAAAGKLAPANQQKPDNSNLDANKRNRSWLGEKIGGVVKKFLPKDSNEMILPEDRTKTIVWDESTGRWVNKDGDSPDEVAPPPPPSIAQDMNSNYHQNQGQQQQTNNENVQPQMFSPQLNVSPAPQPATKPNRFSGHGKRYVSVNAFGVTENSFSPNSLGAPSPPLDNMYGQQNFSSASSKTYFVPRPVDNGLANEGNPAESDPFSTPVNTN